MKERHVLFIIAMGAMCVTMEGLALIWYGWRCMVLLALAMTLVAVMCMAIRDLDDAAEIDDPLMTESDDRKSCAGCKRYLGGGMCRSSLEAECAEGSGYEMYEAE